MSQCPFQSRLSAFHDHELDADTVQHLEAHLSDCPACNETLAGIRAVSRLLNGAAANGRMSQMGMARLHATADASAKKPELFPMAKMLIAVAASVFVIAGAWLVEIPSHTGAPSGAATATHSQPEAQWEKLASGGKLILPNEIAHETGMARDQEDFSTWMIRSLNKEKAPKKESGS